MAKVEGAVEHIERDIAEIKSDLRLLLIAFLVAAVGLAGLIAHGFKWI